MRLGGWLRRLAALALYRPEVCACTILHTNDTCILMRAFLLKCNLWNYNAVSRRNSARSFGLKCPHGSWVGTCRYRILSSAANNWLDFRARYSTPVRRVTRTHHRSVLGIILRWHKLLLGEGIWNHVFTWGHVTWGRCCEFTARWPFVLELYLHLLVWWQFIIDVLRGDHHGLDHLLMLMWRCGTVVAGIDGSWIWGWRLILWRGRVQ